jgi:hypothetical protein
MTKALRQWKWGILPTYNGFTHDERVIGWQAMWWMIDKGQLMRPTTCSISGLAARIQMHSENYYDADPLGINQSIHMALHQRFKRPDAWLRIVNRFSVTGDEWFATLSLEQVDIAADLRSRHGDGITNLLGRLRADSAKI